MSRTKGLMRAAVAAAILLAPVPGARSAPAVEPELTDANITDAIERECGHDPAVSGGELEVATADGVVTLTGTADNILARERAVRIAEAVRGVRSIVDRVRVQPAERRADGAIRDDIRTALLVDPATDSYDVSVEVRDGTATLSGKVQSWRERELCGTVAKGVRGVTELANRIDVDFAAERPDLEIREDIRQTLRWNVLVDDALIRVAVEDGAVTLTGIVGSAAEKREARFGAWTTGVRSVDVSGLKVERWARDEDLREGKYAVAGESEIENALQRALLQDPRVASFNVETTVDGGQVTLRGTVDNLTAKRAAENDARNTVGVLGVDNRLLVRPKTGGSDQAIEKAMRLALARDPFIWSFDVDVRVEQGTAYLNGVVDSFFDRARADEIAGGVAGVIEVVNELRVESYARAFHPLVDEWAVRDYHADKPNELAMGTADQTDERIAEEVESQLWWSPFVDSDEVDVQVTNGVARLTGTVDTWAERGAARDNAYDAGAVLVRNELEVE